MAHPQTSREVTRRWCLCGHSRSGHRFNTGAWKPSERTGKLCNDLCDCGGFVEDESRRKTYTTRGRQPNPARDLTTAILQRQRTDEKFPPLWPCKCGHKRHLHHRRVRHGALVCSQCTCNLFEPKPTEAST